MLNTSTDRFLAQAGALPAEQLASAFDRAVRLRRAGGKEASRAAKPSAAVNSELEHTVRELLLPRSEELNAARAGLHADAKSAIVIAGRAVQQAAQLTPEQYEILLTPFTELGVEVPAHPDAAR